VLRLWPFSFGLEGLVRLIGLPAPAPGLITRPLRGFPPRLQFNPRTYQGRFLYYRGPYEEPQIRTLRRLLRPGMTFVDVGANIGLYSVVAGYCVGPAGKVIAFEPQQGLADVFWENVRINGLDNVIREPVALGRMAGMSSLFRVNDNDGQATLRLRPDERSVGAVVVVPVRRLSDVLHEHNIASVDGVKIDVEGGELEVFEGFEGLDRPRTARIHVSSVSTHSSVVLDTAATTSWISCETTDTWCTCRGAGAGPPFRFADHTYQRTCSRFIRA
jgi:FkbM family methyltransferase